MVPGGQNDGEEVIHQAIVKSDLFDLGLKIQYVLPGEHRVDLVCGMQQRRTIQNLLFFIRCGLANAKPHEKSF